MKVRISGAAEQDLESILDFIAQDSPKRALTFAKELRRRCMEIGRFPNKGLPLPSSSNPMCCRIVHGNYLIFYRVGADTVEVIRVLNGALDYRHLLFPDEF